MDWVHPLTEKAQQTAKNNTAPNQNVTFSGSSLMNGIEKYPVFFR